MVAWQGTASPLPQCRHPERDQSASPISLRLLCSIWYRHKNMMEGNNKEMVDSRNPVDSSIAKIGRLTNVKIWEFGVIEIYNVDVWKINSRRHKIVVDMVKRNIW